MPVTTTQRDNIYYKVPVDSFLGSRIGAVAEKIRNVNASVVQFCQETGVTKFNNPGFCCAGISAFQFTDAVNIDKSILKKEYGTVYSPKRNIKAGKELAARMDGIGSVQYIEVSKACGVDGFWPAELVRLHPNEIDGHYVLQSVRTIESDDISEITHSEYVAAVRS